MNQTKSLSRDALRGSGYCLTSNCPDLYKGVFQLFGRDVMQRREAAGQFGLPETFCRLCGCQMHIEWEHSHVEDRDGLPFTRVKLEYNYDPSRAGYKECAIVLVDSAGQVGSTYTFYSPIIKTGKCALQTAERILGALNRIAEPLQDNDYPDDLELLLDFDLPREQFQARLPIISWRARPARSFPTEEVLEIPSSRVYSPLAERKVRVGECI